MRGWGDTSARDRNRSSFTINDCCSCVWDFPGYGNSPVVTLLKKALHRILQLFPVCGKPPPVTSSLVEVLKDFPGSGNFLSVTSSLPVYFLAELSNLKEEILHVDQSIFSEKLGVHPRNMSRSWMQNPAQREKEHAHPEPRSRLWVNKQVQRRFFCSIA